MVYEVLIALTILGDPVSWPDGVIPPSPLENPGYLESDRPLWLQAALAANRNAAERYGHTLDVKQLPGPPFIKAQIDYCSTLPADQPNGPFPRRNCYKSAHRNNCTWYKFKQILDYLLANVAEYVLFVDCDAFIMQRQDHDPVAKMVDVMNQHKVDIMVADEDWRGAVGATNTGVILARNCNWTTTFLSELLAMRLDGRCKTNEQACFRSVVSRDDYGAKSHVLIDSGLKWNRHPADKRDPQNVKMDWDTNANTEIVHFMGGAKGGLEKLDVADNGACPADAVGTSQCVDVDHCAAAVHTHAKGVDLGKRALVLVDALEKPPGQRFGHVAAMRSLLAIKKEVGADAVYIVPAPEAAQYPMTAAERTVLTSHGFVVHTVPWILPSSLSAADVGTVAGMCGTRGMLTLHALGLSDYTAVVVFGEGMLARQGLASLLTCAADKSHPRFLHAGVYVPRVAAWAPKKDVLDAAVRYASTWRGTGVPFNASNGEDCGLALVADMLCVSAESGAAVTTALHCHPIDPCKWGRVGGDDEACSSIHVPCSQSRVATAQACY
eukprot:m.65465 g.65465  ORF g.65465 m.65465 type:complete len:552 (-) comp8293_c0_seq1:78-1733(-)